MAKALDIALVQLTTPADQAGALAHAAPLVRQAAATGARLVLLPECANLMEQRRDLKFARIVAEDGDLFVAGMKALAAELEMTLVIGSVIVAAEGDHRAANRTLLIGPDGKVRARYDKIHLFDADTPDGRSYRESATVRAGTQAVVAEACGVRLGLSICYDVRFAYLYRDLAGAGAEVISVPAAFTVPTGQAHWEVMLRARAIETGAYILAPAQGGTHEDGRQTFGRSMVVGPWGEVVAALDDDSPAILKARLDLAEVEKARGALPQLQHARAIELP